MKLSLRPESLIPEPDTSHPADTAFPEYAPSLSSSRALARFEFEAGRGNEGTKILMVQWSNEDLDSDWEISWDGKTTVLPAKDVVEDKLLRIYFLLAPGSSIPRVVNISRPGKESPHMQTNPLPAIFTPELGVTTHGRKGMLHTLWAKKRLSILQKEIEQEMKNGEGVGLEMALQERQWIYNNFGIAPKSGNDTSQTMPNRSLRSPSNSRFSEKMKGLKVGLEMALQERQWIYNNFGIAPKSGNDTSQTMPNRSLRSPSNSRFSEKMKGLKVATNPSQLVASSKSGYQFGQDPASTQSLSPDSSDVAVSSFSLFQSPQRTSLNNQTPRIGSRKGNFVVSSLDAILNDELPERDEIETEDELFAVKLSPRSPEMTRSPFSLVGAVE